MDIYHDHIEAEAKLKFWRKKEIELRNKIIEGMEGKKDEGTVKNKVGNLSIKAIFKINRYVDAAALDNIYDDLSIEEKEAIKFKPEVVAKHFRKLEEEGKSVLLEAVTSKPGQASLEIEEI